MQRSSRGEIADQCSWLVAQLLPARDEIRMDVTDGGQLVPDQSTAALAIHHAEAICFSAFGAGLRRCTLVL